MSLFLVGVAVAALLLSVLVPRVEEAHAKERPVAQKSQLVTVTVHDVALTVALGRDRGCAELEDARQELVHKLKLCREPDGLVSIDLERGEHSKDQHRSRRFRVRAMPVAGKAVPVASVDGQKSGRLEVTLRVD